MKKPRLVNKAAVDTLILKSAIRFFGVGINWNVEKDVTYCLWPTISNSDLRLVRFRHGGVEPNSHEVDAVFSS